MYRLLMHVEFLCACFTCGFLRLHAYLNKRYKASCQFTVLHTYIGTISHTCTSVRTVHGQNVLLLCTSVRTHHSQARNLSRCESQYYKSVNLLIIVMACKVYLFLHFTILVAPSTFPHDKHILVYPTPQTHVGTSVH
jgi:hypothetical protein